jgi:hypothetical protein
MQNQILVPTSTPGGADIRQLAKAYATADGTSLMNLTVDTDAHVSLEYLPSNYWDALGVSQSYGISWCTSTPEADGATVTFTIDQDQKPTGSIILLFAVSSASSGSFIACDISLTGMEVIYGSSTNSGWTLDTLFPGYPRFNWDSASSPTTNLCAVVLALNPDILSTGPVSIACKLYGNLTLQAISMNDVQLSSFSEAVLQLTEVLTSPTSMPPVDITRGGGYFPVISFSSMDAVTSSENVTIPGTTETLPAPSASSLTWKTFYSTSTPVSNAGVQCLSSGGVTMPLTVGRQFVQLFLAIGTLGSQGNIYLAQFQGTVYLAGMNIPVTANIPAPSASFGWTLRQNSESTQLLPQLDAVVEYEPYETSLPLLVACLQLAYELQMGENSVPNQLQFMVSVLAGYQDAIPCIQAISTFGAVGGDSLVELNLRSSTDGSHAQTQPWPVSGVGTGTAAKPLSCLTAFISTDTSPPTIYCDFYRNAVSALQFPVGVVNPTVSFHYQFQFEPSNYFLSASPVPFYVFALYLSASAEFYMASAFGCDIYGGSVSSDFNLPAFVNGAVTMNGVVTLSASPSALTMTNPRGVFSAFQAAGVLTNLTSTVTVSVSVPEVVAIGFTWGGTVFTSSAGGGISGDPSVTASVFSGWVVGSSPSWTKTLATTSFVATLLAPVSDGSVLAAGSGVDEQCVVSTAGSLLTRDPLLGSLISPGGPVFAIFPTIVLWWSESLSTITAIATGVSGLPFTTGLLDISISLLFKPVLVSSVFKTISSKLSSCDALFVVAGSSLLGSVACVLVTATVDTSGTTPLVSVSCTSYSQAAAFQQFELSSIVLALGALPLEGQSTFTVNVRNSENTATLTLVRQCVLV